MGNGARTGWMFLLCMVLALFLATFGIAQTIPEGPDTLEQTNQTKASAALNLTANATAGNISMLTLTGTSVSQTWAGYYGNVTGTISLENSGGSAIYRWQVDNEEGEVYAAINSSVDWTTGNVNCFNMSPNTKAGTDAHASFEDYETEFNIGLSDVDGINETFDYSINHTTFYVGGQLINGTGAGYGHRGESLGLDGSYDDYPYDGTACAAVRLFNSTHATDTSVLSGQEGTYEEVLLFDHTNKGIIFTSILEETPPLGFNGLAWDFQMIVLDDGHNGDTSSTTYYFYVELE